MPEAVSAKNDADLGYRMISDLLGMLDSFFEHGLVSPQIVLQPRLFVDVVVCVKHPLLCLGKPFEKVLRDLARYLAALALFIMEAVLVVRVGCLFLNPFTKSGLEGYPQTW